MVPREAYVAHLYRIGHFTVCRMDGNWIRSNIDPDFSNFAHHLIKKYVPPNELWVDQERVPGETVYYVTNMLVQHKLMSGGVPYSVALSLANKIEHKERTRHARTQPIVHPYPITDLFLDVIGQTAGCQVILINGDHVRKDWEPNFTEGGHDLIYPWLPPNTIIIDNDVKLTERAPTLLHESTERPLMEQGMPYHMAHLFALQAEWEWRHRRIKTARYALSRRMTFKGLQISVETDKGEKRHWYDPHNKEHGTTTMKYPYGYIRRTEGTDGDHVDVYVGPNEDAKSVYIIHQMKAPDFKKYDEDKCMLGFDSLEDAKKAYLAHYNDSRFLGNVTTMPFDEFKTKVLKTFDHPKKLAGVMDQNLKLAYDLGVQYARQKFAAPNTMIGGPPPTWGLKGPTPKGFRGPQTSTTQRPTVTTHEGVSTTTHAGRQQSNRDVAGTANATNAAKDSVGNVTAKSNEEMRQAVRANSNPGIPPANPGIPPGGNPGVPPANPF